MWRARSTPASAASNSSVPQPFSPTTTASDFDDAFSPSDSVSRRRSLVSTFANLARPKAKQKSSLRFTFDPTAQAPKESEHEGAESSSMRSKSIVNAPSASSAPNSEPLLTLLLTSTSFLDTTITDEGRKLYIIDTRANRTSVCREEPGKGIVHCGAIHWVQENAVDRTLGIVQETSVHMAGGRKITQREFLKSSTFSK